jgi:uncharacterized membrane protein YvlD (DUF360 family)
MKKPLTIITTATIMPVVASVASILGIQIQTSQQKFERKGRVNKRFYRYYLAGTMIAIAGILHLVVASQVLGGANGIMRSVLAPDLLTAGFSITKLGFFFLVAGIMQLFWLVPMTKRWGRKWYYIGICGTIALIALYTTTRGPNPITIAGVDIPTFDIPTEIVQIGYVAMTTMIIIVENKQRAALKQRELLG